MSVLGRLVYKINCDNDLMIRMFNESASKGTEELAKLCSNKSICKVCSAPYISDSKSCDYCGTIK